MLQCFQMLDAYLVMQRTIIGWGEQAREPVDGSNQNHADGKMVHSEGVFTNQILEELAGWEKILQHTSLSQTFDPDELEGGDEDAPRDRRLATVRRRRRRS